MKVVIIGAGCIGCAVASQLIAAGNDVTLIARNERLAQLEKNGMQFYKQHINPFKKAVLSTLPVVVKPELTNALTADIILVTVQRNHMQALLPALQAHPCKTIVFMCNYAADMAPLTASLGDKLFWAFPAMLAGLDKQTGISHHIILPRLLSFLQLTTVASVVKQPATEVIARRQQLLNLFNAANIASGISHDIASWLKTHAALMLPLIASGSRNIAAGRPLQLTWQECGLAAKAMGECFNVVVASGSALAPLNIKLLAQLVPTTVVHIVLFFLFKTTAVQSALRGHADHAAGEVAQLFADMQHLAAASNLPIVNLSKLCSD